MSSDDDDDDDDDDTEEISIFSNDARGRVKKGVFGVVVVVVRAAVSRRRGCFDGIVAGVGGDAAAAGRGGARGRGLCATARLCWLCWLCRLCRLWRVAGGGACEAGEDVAQVNVLEGGRELPLLRDVPAREGEGERVLTRACPRSGVRG